MFTSNFCGQEWIFPMVVNLVHESMFSIFVFMIYKKKIFLRPYGELESHQSCFGKVMVASLHISNHWTLLKMG